MAASVLRARNKKKKKNCVIEKELVDVLQLYPLWLCPFKLFDNPGFVHPSGPRDEMYVDIGAYGAPTVDDYNNVETTKRLEKYVTSVKG